jgi:hypothetical protein
MNPSWREFLEESARTGTEPRSNPDGDVRRSLPFLSLALPLRLWLTLTLLIARSIYEASTTIPSTSLPAPSAEKLYAPPPPADLASWSCLLTLSFCFYVLFSSSQMSFSSERAFTTRSKIERTPSFCPDPTLFQRLI